MERVGRVVGMRGSRAHGAFGAFWSWPGVLLADTYCLSWAVPAPSCRGPAVWISTGHGQPRSLLASQRLGRLCRTEPPWHGDWGPTVGSLLRA